MRAGLIGMRHGGICVHAGVPRARAPGLTPSPLLSLSLFVSYPAVLPVCRGGTRRVIPATPGEAGREREMRDNDDDDDDDDDGGGGGWGGDRAAGSISCPVVPVLLY